MAKKFKCPYCDKRKERADLIKHVETKHIDLIPANFSPTRIVFNYINYNDLNYDGKCVICGNPTDWDEDKARYNRFCNNPNCKKQYVHNVESNMLRTKGVKRISQTIDGQEKMLANRHISGNYKWSDGSIKTYTGTYELKALEYLDKVMGCKSEDVITPGPTMQYEYEGELHWYISDIFYIPYNLIIEVKDGGDRPNTRNMPEYRAKQIAKEKHIIDNTNYNYLRLTNNDFSQILAIMSDLKLQLKENITDRVININENMFAAMQGMMPIYKPDSIYVINYMKNNAFGGESDFAISDSPKFDRIFYRNSQGILKEGNRDILKNTTYDLYVVRNAKERCFDKMSLCLNKFIDEGYIYRTVFEEELYTPDQIKFNEFAEATIDLYSLIKETNSVVKNYIDGVSGTLIEGSTIVGYDFGKDSGDFGAVTYARIDKETGVTYVESTSIIGLIAEENNPTQRAIVRMIDDNIIIPNIKSIKECSIEEAYNAYLNFIKGGDQ